MNAGGGPPLTRSLSRELQQIGRCTDRQYLFALNRILPAGTNREAENYRRQQGASAVPVLRYFMVMGCCLLGLLFVADYLIPKEAAPAPVEAAAVSNGGSLASWRQ